MKLRILLLVVVGGYLCAVAWQMQSTTPPPKRVARPKDDPLSKGLDFLASKQSDDGNWDGDGGQHPVAMTGLVGLAFLLEVQDPDPRVGREDQDLSRRYLHNVRHAADWLLRNAHPNGDGPIFSDHPSETDRYMEGHGLATIFLAGLLQAQADKLDPRTDKLKSALDGAVKYIAKSQSSRGGWHHTSRAEGHDLDDVLPTVIQLQALKAAENARIAIPGHVMRDGQAYLSASSRKLGGKDRLVETAAAAAATRRHESPRSSLMGNHDDSFKTWSKDCQQNISVGINTRFGRDELAHFFYAQAIVGLGNEIDSTSDRDRSNQYYTKMSEILKAKQSGDGSWPAGDGLCVGSVYSTAIWCTILQLDRKHHPSEDQSIYTTTD